MFMKNVTSGLKSGWCVKHKNIKENEAMTIKIIRAPANISKLVYYFNTGTGKSKNIKDVNNVSTNSRDVIKVERYFWGYTW